MLPVALNVPVVGSYRSAVAVSFPPATSAFPLWSNVAVADSRAMLMLPVATNVPLAGS